MRRGTCKFRYDRPLIQMRASILGPYSPLYMQLEGTNEDADAAIAAAVAAQKGWAALSGHTRARHLYSVARHLQVSHHIHIHMRLEEVCQ